MSSVESRKHSGHRLRLNAADQSPQEPGPKSPSTRSYRTLVSVIVISLLLLVTAALTSRRWLPQLSAALGGADSVGKADDDHDHAAESGGHGEEEGHDEQVLSDESHPGHDEATSLELSEQGRKNIGLTLATVQLQSFERTVSMPAKLVQRPGQTAIAVSAPMTGIVARIYILRGEAVSPGARLFDLRLTHEDLVEKQSSLLRQLEELDVIRLEVTRLRDVTASGAVAGKRLLEAEYEQQKTEAAIRAERQALTLHGLSEEQVTQIVEQRQLLQMLTIVAPPLTECQSCSEHDEFLQVAELPVSLGEHVTTGTRLATLTDHCELHVEGNAFEQDAEALNEAANASADVTAVIDINGTQERTAEGLRILYVENEIQRDSRALKFYVRLPNELVRNEVTAEGHRFIGWRYKPGQRVELLVPVERWTQRIVLPVEAVVQEGAEAYVYQETHGHFDRKSVHVEYRDQRSAVIENDGALVPGDKVAARGAYQIHLALKNKSGGGPDPHAGHQH